MDKQPDVVRTISDLRARVAEARHAGKRVGLVPTMGALHHGHLSLVDAISAHADMIIVSIFVNPTQFGEGEDFDAYPRDEKDDLNKLAPTAASLVYAPTAQEMYPEGDSTKVSVADFSERFEGAHRLGHFDGVATVVSKLLMQCLPDIAVFGEKDYQQLAVIRQFVKDLAIPTTIMGAPIVREMDGLAASSRNVYLSAHERQTAGQLNVVLSKLVDDVKSGSPIADAEKHASQSLLAAGFDAVDYVNVVNSATLQPLTTLSAPARVLAVARLGAVRLLDNMAIEAP